MVRPHSGGAHGATQSDRTERSDHGGVPAPAPPRPNAGTGWQPSARHGAPERLVGAPATWPEHRREPRRRIVPQRRRRVGSPGGV